MASFRQYTLKVNEDAIKAAQDAVKACAEKWDAISAKIEELPPVTERKNGTQGLADREELLQKYSDECTAAAEAAIKKIDTAKKDFDKYISEQVTPSAKDFEECRAAYDMLNAGLIENAALYDFADMWKDNAAMRAAITKYTKDNRPQAMEDGFITEGVIFTDKREEMKDFSNYYFYCAKKACKAPRGRSYYGLFIEDKKAVCDMVRAYDLVEELHYFFD